MLYPNCIPVMGHKNIAFYDFDRQNFESYPKDKLMGNIEHVQEQRFELGHINKKGLEVLKDNGFLLNEASAPNSNIQVIENYEWLSPSTITNAIIDITNRNGLIIADNFKKLLNILADLLCKDLVIRVKEYISLNGLKKIIARIESSNTNSLQLILPYFAEYYSDDFGEIVMVQGKISYVIIESSPFKKNIEDKIFFTEGILKPSCIKNEDKFRVNVILYSESQKHHTYFNRKLYIGPNGEIKNAPECKEEFGWIQQIENTEQIRQIIALPEFQKYWYVHKDLCDICSDCEFRHMCVDNRIPYQKSNGSWYHQQKCNYNPYTGKWESE